MVVVDSVGTSNSGFHHELHAFALGSPSNESYKNHEDIVRKSIWKTNYFGLDLKDI